MTKTEWLTATKPDRLILHLRLRTREPASHRKLRLFSCAALGHLAALPAEVVSIYDAVQCWADEPENRAEIRGARQQVRLLQAGFASAVNPLIDWELCRGYTSPIVPRGMKQDNRLKFLGILAARVLTTTARADREGRVSGKVAAWISRCSMMIAGQEESSYHVRLLHDIFGRPRLPKFPLQEHGGTIRQLAHAAYEASESSNGHLASDRIAILADALEEAGCTNAEVLDHCRQPGPHVRGCWVVDQILGKE